MPVGGIQITPAGQPIVLLAGRGTIGGYPLLATVITPDTWALGQVRPGQQVRFEPVTVQVAQELTRQAYAEIEANEPVLTRLEPA
jgi:allophanate hydrolase subunit 2